METRCVKIRLKPQSLPKVEEWAAELTRRADEVRETLEAEGVTLETVFLDQTPEGDFLIYVMQAEDFDKATQVAKASTAAIDVYHQAFKKACWEEHIPLRKLIDVTNP